MSKIPLKPQIISAISRTSTTRSTCRISSHHGTQAHKLRRVTTLEDQFVSLLVQAGSCHKSRIHTTSRQVRTTGTSSGITALTKVDDDDSQQSHESNQSAWEDHETAGSNNGGGTFGQAIDMLNPRSNRTGIRGRSRSGTETYSVDRTPLRPRRQQEHKKRRGGQAMSESRTSELQNNGDDETSSQSVNQQTHKANPDTLKQDTANLRTSPLHSPDLHTPKPHGEYQGLDIYGQPLDLPSIPRSRYQEMVDIYGMPIEEEAGGNHTPSLAAWGTGMGDEINSIVQYPLAPRLTISAEQEDRALRRERQLREALTAEHAQILDQLHSLLREPPGTVHQQKLWRLYTALPSPQVYYLSHKDIDRLFQHLAWVEYKRFQGAKEKVFQLLEHCNTEGISVHRHHWTTAITLAGRWVRNISTEQVREAIETWMSMEQHGIRADPVVFNVLFDVAAKAGRFALADTIHSEMKARDMTIDRYFRCSMIHCAGMRKDGDAVRAAFTDFVAAGDIVDTAVMNLVVRSLIRSGEGEAAEHVFSNMKSLHAEKFPGSNAKTWQERRAFTKGLNKTVIRLRKEQAKHEASFFGSQYSNKGQLEELQRLTPIHPDESTYRIIIGYHALVSGDIGRIQELLSEMKAEGFHIHGSVYVNIFWGFVRHGGYSFSAWTPEILERFWLDFAAAVPYANVVERFSPHPETGTTSYVPTFEDVDHELSVMSEDARPVHYSVIVAKNIMHAFYRCCGKGRMIKAWKDIQTEWQTMSPDEEAILHAYCRKRLREHIWQDSQHG